MKRAIAVFFIVSFLLLMAAPKVQSAIMLFLLVGAIPGTNWSVPPLVMIGMSLLALAAVIRWIARQDFYAQLHRPVTAAAPIKTSLAKSSRRRRKQATTRQVQAA